MKIISIIVLTLNITFCFSQQDEVSLSQLFFLEGEWKAVAKDSSFSSILNYEYSPEKKLLYATNQLYGKNGKVFRTYEGSYFLDNKQLGYFLSGPKGETHKGSATVQNDTLTHLAKVYLNEAASAYRSQMTIKNGKLFYFARYSKSADFPSDVDYINPLIYERVQKKSIEMIPEWYLKDMKRVVGKWIADNKEYMNTNEKDDSYGIEWKWGVGKKSLVGVLYGIKDGKKTNEYWQFFQYWDKRKGKPKVFQVASYGTIGEGYLEIIDDKNIKLVQIFINPDGTTFKSGHKTEVFENKEISTSYDIDENGNWKKKRSYTWNKQ